MDVVVLQNFGAFFMAAGGVLLMAGLLGVIADYAGYMWMEASKKWRAIVKAESLIYEYKKNRDAFLRWKEEKHDEHCNY